MVGKICDVLLLIGKLVQAVLAKIHTAKRQSDREALHDNPGDWFDDHFCGLCDEDVANETTETESSD